jgi:hypothetical protein
MEQTIYISLHEEMIAEIEERASSLKLSADQYIQVVLEDVLEYGDTELVLQDQR